MEFLLEEFNQFVKQFIPCEDIIRKYTHSIRVSQCCIAIAKSLNLDIDTIKLAGVVGLLHDIGRFEQWEKYHTYDDKASVDHADLGVKILLENQYIEKYIKGKDKIDKALIAIKNHNKYAFDSMQDEKCIQMQKIIRDADKLDLLITQCNGALPHDLMVSDGVLDSIYEHKSLDNKKRINDADYIVSQLCFLFDLNFRYSFQYIKDHHIVEEKLKLLECHCGGNENYNHLQKEVLNYINMHLQ